MKTQIYITIQQKKKYTKYEMLQKYHNQDKIYAIRYYTRIYF